MSTLLVELKDIKRSFVTGELKTEVLKGVNLSISKGEFIAIIGASGSGKSTLMNLIGGLDYPSSGYYYFKGKDISEYSDDDLAKLRREHFGFIFQRYHLLDTLTAKGNVEMPAIYYGMESKVRDERAAEILSDLGLGERIDFYPSQLSGGQQQRVSIARALMNGGEVILADEPTGALDSESGKLVLNILKTLNEKGHTIIMVTHDANVAAHADRIIEIKDGLIINDTQHKEKGAEKNMEEAPLTKGNPYILLMQRFFSVFNMALLSMRMQRMRTFLTMLGIIIGIASVVLVMALGKGTTDKIINDINAMGTSTLTVFSGTGFGDRNAGRVRSLKPSDVTILQGQTFVHSVSPMISTVKNVRFKNISAVNATVSGIGYQYFDAIGYDIVNGISFDANSEKELSLEAVIDKNVIEKLFVEGEDPIGQVIMLDHLPVAIIGVAESKAQGMGGKETMNIWIPYSTAMKRMIGQTYLNNITIRVNDNVNIYLAEKQITEILTDLHGKQDFFIFNADTIRATVEETTMILRWFIISIALISLLVGGIGVMNIMLVSVAERTREIGMRMAVGARKSDVSQQFLIESILVCILGGICGLSLAFCIGYLFMQTSEGSIAISFSTLSIILSLTSSFCIGIIFGYFPAKRAANLAPIDALESA